MDIQEAYRTPNRLDQKRNFSRHIITKTPNAQNEERILKAVSDMIFRLSHAQLLKARMSSYVVL